jgi:hypothetical protein
MSDQNDWDFAGPGDAKAEIRAAVVYLLKEATGGDRADLVQEIIEIVRHVANGPAPEPSPGRWLDRRLTGEAPLRDSGKAAGEVRELAGGHVPAGSVQNLSHIRHATASVSDSCC